MKILILFLFMTSIAAFGDSFEAAPKGKVKGGDAAKFDQMLEQLVLSGEATPTAKDIKTAGKNDKKNKDGSTGDGNMTSSRAASAMAAKTTRPASGAGSAAGSSESGGGFNPASGAAKVGR